MVAIHSCLSLQQPCLMWLIVLQDGDAVVIFNFRSDRVTELSKALEYDDFTAFDRYGTFVHVC